VDQLNYYECPVDLGGADLTHTRQVSGQPVDAAA